MTRDLARESSFSRRSFSIWLITSDSRVMIFDIFLFSSVVSGTASSAAADGVGALLSAAKSQIVKSVSCPTADITGIADAATALATPSSLNAHKSSIEPPPRPMIITSTERVMLK